MSKEVLTYQIGNFSNSIGAHFWNFHHENGFSSSDTDYNVLFRSRLDTTGGWKPRVILVDLKDSLYGLSECGGLHNRSVVEEAKKQVFSDDTLSESNVEVYEQAPAKPGELSDCWSACMTYDLYPDSIQLVSDYQSSSTDYHFTHYGLGKELLDRGPLAEEMDDKLRFWMEECDNLDGFQLLLDAHDGFSGIGGSVVTNLHDEFPRKARLAYVNWPTAVRQSSLDAKLANYVLALNLGLTIADLHEHASLFTVQSLRADLFAGDRDIVKVPGMDVNPETNVRASALLAEAVAGISSPCLLTESRVPMSDVCSHINQGVWRMFAVSYGAFMPRAGSVGQTLMERAVMDGSYFNGLTSCLLPFAKPPFTELLSLGAFVYGVSPADLRPREISPSLLSRLRLYHDVFAGGPASLVRTLTELLHSTSASNCVSYYTPGRGDLLMGNLQARVSRNKAVVKRHEASVSCAFVTRKSEGIFSAVLDLLSQLKLAKLHWLQEFGLDRDSFLELQNTLQQIRSSFCTESDQEAMDVGG